MTTDVHDEFLTGIGTFCNSQNTYPVLMLKLFVGYDVAVARNAAEILALANWMRDRAAAVLDYAQEAAEWERRGGGVHTPNPIPADFDPLAEQK